MNALTQPAGPIAAAATAPLLRTLVLCDLVDSTALVERLGDQRSADLLRKHDRVFRALLPKHGGREIDKTDGFLAMFDRPIQAVTFALDYQRGLQQFNQNENSTLAARVGIHVGDVLTWDNTPDDIAKGAKLTEVEGLVKPITSRLMQLALPGQTLLSGVAYSLAHRAQGELGELLSTVRWRTYGRYRFKGIPDPIPVFEVGEDGRAPLRAPPWSGKAHREVPFWRRPATVAIETVLLLVLIAAPLWYLLRTPPAIAFANRDWVVVGDMKNLTSQASFDESVQTAFRIGLEQSRYVNVMSDLKTRETVKLMQRDPDKTAIDRATGSEVAIRDGARALILPTIAEIGGRVRVTAEVVDPQTQTTVYSESADGIGEDSVLPSLDRVNQKLRVRLGEALATVSNESKPLDKATTKNLEALRAYSLGRQAYNANDSKQALALLQQAIGLDPDFALARTAVANIYLNVGENTAALKQIDLALAAHDRLSTRDAMYIDARRALFGPPEPALVKLKTLARLYPDFFLAQGWLGYASWQYANRFDDAIKAYQGLESPRNPDSGQRDAVMGMFYLGQEKYEEADQHFAKGASMGTDFVEFRAASDAARRNFKKIEATLAADKNVNVDGQDVTTQGARASFAADQGRWDEVWSMLAQDKAKVVPDKPRSLRKLTAIEVSLRALLAPDADLRARLQKFLDGEITALDSESGLDRTETLFHVLFAGYLAAGRGDIKLAQSAVAHAVPEPASGDYPILSRMLAATRAEIARASGNPQESINLLLAQPLDGNELYVTHVALMDAYAAKPDPAAALVQARWLSEHRGRAYTEYNAEWMARPFNVTQSDLALLRAAELSSALGDAKQSKSYLDAFAKAWPGMDRIAALSSRVEKLATPH